MKTIPHGTSAKNFIDWVNFNTRDEATRCRILLAEVLLRLEKIDKKSVDDLVPDSMKEDW